jgi:hypothetical protein
MRGYIKKKCRPKNWHEGFLEEREQFVRELNWQWKSKNSLSVSGLSKKTEFWARISCHLYRRYPNISKLNRAKMNRRMLFPAGPFLSLNIGTTTTYLGIGCAIIIMITGVAVMFDYQKSMEVVGFRKFMQPDTDEKGKEQWIRTMTFSCVKCNATFLTRDELLRHYDATRHDKYA